MNRRLFASHLGFQSWLQLMDASEVLWSGDGAMWYLTPTNTWYKWVVWNTDYDMYFNFPTQSAARKFLTKLNRSANKVAL